MLKNIILEFDSAAERLEIEDIFEYKGHKDLSKVKSLEAIADTREMTLSFLGDLFPSLEKLRLNNSTIPSIRDISSNLKNLRFLSLAHCEIESLDGISTISEKLEELYLAFNHINDFTELIGMNRLRILDLEENDVKNLADCAVLSCCKSLRALTLAGNPAAERENYRKDVMSYVPQLIYLDEKRLVPKKSSSSTPVRSQTKDIKENKELNEVLKQNEEQQAVIPLIKKKEVDTTKRSTSSVKFSLTPVKSPKSEKCVKPRTAEEPRRETTVTEYIEDMVEERPPTSRGHYSKNVMDSWLKPVSKPSIMPKNSASKNSASPKILRPVSSCSRSRASRI
ncbi:hypothetical protein TRFO_42071 [Tritrichomonas foetus]|uniref:Leucine Rich Repeat family protein n=1 Tax=Tritrichomonas foetus TaxID=1144522 RepID=A0A1J4KXV2_9EUKA|nr:hypothetical protein TRFO_42071 [Tritrichomonas foetus]|eukprot:OHT16081.1 hypothetical protein TRFO_42071 [Tritrichomonas foetus]